MRIIPKIEIKNNNLVKGIGFEGLRVLGDPKIYINFYNKTIADEFFIIDVVSSLYGNEHNFKILENFCGLTSVPITVSGGLRSMDDIDKAFLAGADKVSINSALYKNPKIVKQITNIYGSQAVSANLEVIEQNEKFLLFSEFGKEPVNYILEDKVKELYDLGIGEINISSVIKDGTLSGANYKVLEIISKYKKTPIIYGGGINSFEEIRKIEKNFEIDGLMIGSLFHYNFLKKNLEKQNLLKNKIGNKDFISDKENLKKIPKLKNFDFKKLSKKNEVSIQKRDKKKIKICILNLKAGNIFSLKNFLKKFSLKFFVSDNTKEIMRSDLLIISGDCNSSFCIKQIKKKKLLNTIKYFYDNKMLIGICSGMQIMFDKINEGKISPGLKLFSGSVSKISDNKEIIKLPNVGWRELIPFEKKDIFKINKKNFYFLHSYRIKNFSKKECLYFSNYKSKIIPSIFKKNKTLLFQFHPEKSGVLGQNLLYNSIDFLISKKNV